MAGKIDWGGKRTLRSFGERFSIDQERRDWLDWKGFRKSATEGFSKEPMDASAGLLPFPEVPSEIVRYLGLLL